VAILLREHRGELWVLLVQRATREGDRWSGHIALPGGVRQIEDPSTLHTARRETLEEIGVVLEAEHFLGAADEARALVHGGRRPMRVAPYVFACDREIASLAFSDEVVDAFWFPLDRAGRGDFDGLHWHQMGRIPLPFGAWHYQGRCVWGITYGILRRLLTRIY
jgi:8-oxo-dGTP pyrophosphatase MutT (NUDIX family)